MFHKDGAGYDGFCFACNTFVENPYEDKPVGYKPVVISKSPEQIQQEIQEIDGYTTVGINERKLKKEYLEYFGVKVAVSESDGTTPTAAYFPYFNEVGNKIGYKVRLLEMKRMWATGTTKMANLFGWSKAIETGGKKLFITEGEFDAVALFQIMKEHNLGSAYADLNPAVVSLVNGASSAPRDLVRFLPEIKKHFKDIILVFDQDEPGRKAAEEVAKLIPEVLIAALPAKDANECLIKGISKACYSAVQFNSQKVKNTRLVLGDELHEKAKEPPKFGVSWPWKHITEATRGIRLGETIYIGAGQKQG